MKIEVQYLIYVCILTAVMWLPYVLERVLVQGLADAVGYPDQDARPTSAWARRLKKAHYNAVENLVVFAPLVLAAQVLGASSETIGTAAVWYFWARIVHAVSYLLAIPWVRTLSFTAGWIATLVIAWNLLP